MYGAVRRELQPTLKLLCGGQQSKKDSHRSHFDSLPPGAASSWRVEIALDTTTVAFALQARSSRNPFFVDNPSLDLGIQRCAVPKIPSVKMPGDSCNQKTSYVKSLTLNMVSPKPSAYVVLSNRKNSVGIACHAILYSEEAAWLQYYRTAAVLHTTLNPFYLRSERPQDCLTRPERYARYELAWNSVA